MALFRFALQRVLDRRLTEEEGKRRVVSELEKRRRAFEDALRARQRWFCGPNRSSKQEHAPNKLRTHSGVPYRPA